MYNEYNCVCVLQAGMYAGAGLAKAPLALSPIHSSNISRKVARAAAMDPTNVSDRPATCSVATCPVINHAKVSFIIITHMFNE